MPDTKAGKTPKTRVLVALANNAHRNRSSPRWPLTRGLMEVHGGTLEISSKPGKGTRVIAIFPKDRVVN